MGCGSNLADIRVFSMETDLNLLLQSPITYMNIIGKNVSLCIKQNKIPVENLIVLHDDLEQKIGKFRVVKGTSFK